MIKSRGLSCGRWWYGFLGNWLRNRAHCWLNQCGATKRIRNMRLKIEVLETSFEDICLCTYPENARRYCTSADGCCAAIKSCSSSSLFFYNLALSIPNDEPKTTSEPSTFFFFYILFNVYIKPFSYDRPTIFIISMHGHRPLPPL